MLDLVGGVLDDAGGLGEFVLGHRPAYLQLINATSEVENGFRCSYDFTAQAVGYSRSTSSEGSIPKAFASLRIVEKRGSTSFLSILISCLEEIPADWANCSWVMNLRILCSLTLRPIFTLVSIDVCFPQVISTDSTHHNVGSKSGNLH